MQAALTHGVFRRNVGGGEFVFASLSLFLPLYLLLFLVLTKGPVRLLVWSGLFTRSLRSSYRSLVRSPSRLVPALVLLLCVRALV